MFSRASTVAALLLSALPLFTAARAATNWPFALAVQRWKSPDCGEALSMEGAWGAVHLKQGHCKTWDDGQNFPSFSYQWETYTSHQHLRKDRDCALLIYEKDKCTGLLLVAQDHVNAKGFAGGRGDCFHWDGIPGRSMKLKCRRKGETPEWESEMHWVDAHSDNKHENEFDSHGRFINSTRTPDNHKLYSSYSPEDVSEEEV